MNVVMALPSRRRRAHPSAADRPWQHGLASTQCPLVGFFAYCYRVKNVRGLGVALRTRPPVWGHSIHAPDGGCTRGNTTTATWDQNGKMASQRHCELTALPVILSGKGAKAKPFGQEARSGPDVALIGITLPSHRSIRSLT
jgi:hypothetical protein